MLTFFSKIKSNQLLFCHYNNIDNKMTYMIQQKRVNNNVVLHGGSMASCMVVPWRVAMWSHGVLHGSPMACCMVVPWRVAWWSHGVLHGGSMA